MGARRSLGILGVSFVVSCSTASAEPTPTHSEPIASAQPVGVEANDSVPSLAPARLLTNRSPPSLVPALPVPSESLQALLVLTDGWRSFRGVMTLHERDEGGNGWRPVPELGAMPVVVGRRGMAWGRGLHPTATEGRQKREGDFRTPAGVFDLGEGRGYAERPPAGTTWPYLQSADRFRCDNSPRSDGYNTFIPTRGPLRSRAAAARAGVRRDQIFDLMLFVQHNTNPVERRAGSCVFLHVWAKPGIPTQGCVAMARENLARVMVWLKLEARPVLVQLPRAEHQRFGLNWGLPDS